MAKDNKLRGKPASKLSRTPKSLSPRKNAAGTKKKKKKSNKRSNANEKPKMEKKEWEDANCSVCMEFPHNAVLLLCSSYEKGCRPYMCATSRRYSNCLDQYKKAYTKIASEAPEKKGVSELMCPLCRGQVKGWTVVDPARKYLNAKKRSCMQEGCKFSGSYKELRRHVKGKHPLARPRAVDPVLEEKWKRLEVDRERRDVISTIVSSTPGAVVLGDYVLEPNDHGSGDDDDFYSDDFDSDDEGDDGFGGFDFGTLDLRRVGGGNVLPRRFGLSSFIGGVSGRSLRRNNVFSIRRARIR